MFLRIKYDKIEVSCIIMPSDCISFLPYPLAVAFVFDFYPSLQVHSIHEATKIISRTALCCAYESRVLGEAEAEWRLGLP